MSRGIPYVPLASAPDGSGITLAHIIAASNLAADRCGWDDDYLIPTAKSWRILSAKAGPWRYDMGMPVLEAITLGVTLDGHTIQFTALQSGSVEVEAVMGFGWLERHVPLTDSIDIDTAIIPDIVAAPGDSYLVGNEFVWYDASSAIVRPAPLVHGAGQSIRRVHANTTLASAILRMAGRQKDYEARAGYSSREAQRPAPGAQVEEFQIMDTEVAQTLQPFIRPSVLTWKRPSNYGLLESEAVAPTSSTADPSARASAAANARGLATEITDRTEADTALGSRIDLVGTGAKGDQGDQGDQGDKGDQGDQGDQGVQGVQGVQGDQGDKGDKGDQGDPGTGSGPGGAGTDSTARASIAAEVTARTDADTALEAADGVLTSAISSEASTRAAADTALGARITALPAGGGGGTAFSPTLIFTADDVDLPDDQTTVAITLTAAWDSFDAFYFTASLRNADAINNLILKEDFQRVGVKAAAGTNWYTGTEPQAIFVLDQNLASGGVAGMAICRIADTTMLLLARSFASSTVNAQDIRIWGINYGGAGAKGDKGDKGDPGSGTADSTARASIAAEITARERADTAEAIERDRVDVVLAGVDTSLGGRIDANVTETSAVKVIAEAAQTATEVATAITVETGARTTADTALGGRITGLTFGALTDTPAAIVAEKFVKSNADGDALEYVDEPGVSELATEVDVRGKADTALGNDISTLGTALTAEATTRLNADNAASVINNGTALAGTQETLTRRAEDVILGVRIDNIGVGGGGGEVLMDIAKIFTTNNRLLSLNDQVAVPKTGIIEIEVHAVAAAFSGSFAIPAEEFLTKVGAVDSEANQGENKGFSFPMGQNRAFHISHRIDARGVPRFLAGSSDIQSAKSGDDQGWNITITHITGNGLIDGSVVEAQLAPAVVTKLNSGLGYSPGPAHFRFVGLDRKAAVAARDKYFLGEIALSQAYVDIFSLHTSSYIRVTLDRSVTEQTGVAGNDWNLALGTDHTNTAVTITPNTPGKTFTLRLPDAGITLDALATDLDANSRLHAQVAGNGSALVDYAATWGSTTVGSVSPFRHGGDQSTIERTAWRAEYIANPSLVLVLAYGILEEYQHWAVAVAPAVSDWETVLTLIDPPAPNYKPGPTPNTFSGANRAAAVAALDTHLDGVSMVTQASTRIYSDADNYITVSLDAAVAKGPRGNRWSMRWGGDSSSAGEIELDTVDSLFRAVLKWDVNATTLAGLHAEFTGDSKFTSVVTGDDTSVASVAATFGEDTVGNTIFFTGGDRTQIDVPHTWFAHYVDNAAATITLEYESRQEIQVWDVPSIDFRTAFTLLDSPTKPNPWTVLAHDDSSPDDWQWTAVAGATETELIERSAGTVTNPTRGSARPVVPATAKEIWVRLTKGSADVNMVKLDKLVLPSGDDADLRVEFRLGVSGIHLRLATNGHVYVKRTTGVSGSITVGCDIWYR